MRSWGKLISMIQRYQLKSSGLQRKTLENSGFVYHYAERGTTQTNSPPLLILHGFAESIETWVEVVQKLPKSLHVLALDLPGHGQAPLQFPQDCPAAHASVDSYVHFVHEFIRSMALNESDAGLHVLGHSMGGAVAAQLTASYGASSRVRWLTLAAPAMVTPVASPFWNALLEGKFEEWLIPTTIEGTKSMVMNITGMTEQEADTFKTKCMIKGLMQLRETKTETLKSVWSGLQPDLDRFSEILDSWKKINAKTQILWGSEDLIINASGAELLSTTIPSSFVEIMPGVHHGMNLVVPTQTAAAIMRFREKAAEREFETKSSAKTDRLSQSCTF